MYIYTNLQRPEQDAGRILGPPTPRRVLPVKLLDFLLGQVGELGGLLVFDLLAVAIVALQPKKEKCRSDKDGTVTGQVKTISNAAGCSVRENTPRTHW